MKKYELTQDNPVDPKLMPKGTIVYDCVKYDYGLARDDTYYMKEEYVSVTLKADGDYEFRTCPKRILKEIKK